MRIFGKWISALTLVLSSFLFSTYFSGEPTYESPKWQEVSSFSEFYEAKKKESLEKGVRPENEERLVTFKEPKTPIAFLYIHGFGASRKEGEEVLDKVAGAFGANTYYLLLPGHGTNVEDHLKTPFQKYLETAEQSLIAAQALGEKVFLVGTSMGGMISTYLAGKYPDQVAGVILASPFYNFSDPSAIMYHFTWGPSFVDLALGKIRTSKDPESESFRYWYANQYYGALKNLMNLKRYFDAQDSLSKVKDPVLLFYYYKSEEEQDRAASVPAMIHAFEKIGKMEGSKLVQVEFGDHILFSQYAASDKELLIRETISFVERVSGIPPLKGSKSK